MKVLVYNRKQFWRPGSGFPYCILTDGHKIQLTKETTPKVSNYISYEQLKYLFSGTFLTFFTRGQLTGYPAEYRISGQISDSILDMIFG